MVNIEQKGHGIQSLELGLDILKKIAEQDKPLTITEIANLCEISKSKLHRYLTSFCRSGFLQKSADLKYSFGTELVLLGLKASERLNIKEVAVPYLASLRESLNETVALALWGENGPFYLWWEASNKEVNIGIKAGSQVSITRSAPGKLFVAYLPKEQTEELVKRELESGNIDPATFYEEIKVIRKKGFSIVEGTIVPGISAISCPVFGQDGEIISAITVVSLIDMIDTSENSEMIGMIKEKCSALSKAIGYQPK